MGKRKRIPHGDSAEDLAGQLEKGMKALEGDIFAEKPMTKLCNCPKGQHRAWCPFYEPSKAEHERVRRAEQDWERSLGIR